MKKVAVLNVVGLTPALLPHAPFLSSWAHQGRMAAIKPTLPAVTCSVQSTFVTGVQPALHGIVGNGWYFRDEAEIKFWRQSNHLVQAQKIWEVARSANPDFTCANMFWWYNMYSSVDFSVTPRPMYPSDGRKLPDVYSHPSSLRFELQEELGRFPLFEFWGPNSSIRSSQWIARASMRVSGRSDPTLTLIYLPHLDYVLQREGPRGPSVPAEVAAIDAVCEELISFFEGRGTEVIVLSEYGITDVRRGISLNRLLREHGYIAVREELGRELLDAGASRAFAVADHQIAHIYVNDTAALDDVRALIEGADGVDFVAGERGRKALGLDHSRAGDLIAVADEDAWFTYYYWMDDERAPDFARTVDIHRKPGYDPVELFLDPQLRAPKLRVGLRLIQKTLGFRYLMDVIPLDASLVKGSHGRFPHTSSDGPLIISRSADLVPGDEIHATGIQEVILKHLGL